MKKKSVWRVLVERGIFNDRRTASSWIMQGRVIVDGQRADTEGQLVDDNADIRVKGYEMKYVGKGGLKLEGALADFKVDVKSLVVLDAGASAGGFTDCLIQHGAAKVYAVDAGFGQLAGKLRNDDRVVNMERVNIGEVDIDQLQPRPVLATVDLSYLSLKKAVPVVSQLLDSDGRMICLVKPLFEIADPKVRRTGIIDDPGLYTSVLEDLVGFMEKIDFKVMGVTHSHVTGNRGTREFFIYIAVTGSDGCADIRSDIEKSVLSVMKIPLYEKV